MSLASTPGKSCSAKIVATALIAAPDSLGRITQLVATPLSGRRRGRVALHLCAVAITSFPHHGSSITTERGLSHCPSCIHLLLHKLWW